MLPEYPSTRIDGFHDGHHFYAISDTETLDGDQVHVIPRYLQIKPSLEIKVFSIIETNSFTCSSPPTANVNNIILLKLMDFSNICEKKEEKKDTEHISSRMLSGYCK